MKTAAAKTSLGLFDDMIPAEETSLGLFDDMIPAEEPPPEDGVLDWVKNTAVDAGTGVISFGEGAVGLLDLATGNRVGDALEEYAGYDPQGSKEFLAGFYSEGRKEANQAVEDAEGFTGTMSSLVDHPEVAVGTIVQSLPLMLGSVGAARFAAGRMLSNAGLKPGTEAAAKFLADPKVKKIIGGVSAAAEGATSAGIIQETARQQGRDWSESALPAVAGGVGTAAIGHFGNKILPDVEAQIASDALAAGQRHSIGEAAKNVGKSLVKEGPIEELPQSLQEEAMTNLALGKPIDEGLGKAGAMGLVAGSGTGLGMSSINEVRNQITGTPPPVDGGQPPVDEAAPATPRPDSNDPLSLGPDELNAGRPSQQGQPAPAAPSAAESTVDPEIERPETIQAQVDAFVEGRKPGLLITPGTDLSTVRDVTFPEGTQSVELPEGIFIFRDPAALELAQNGRLGDALGYGIPEKPDSDQVITARKADGTVVQDVVTDGRPEVIEAARRVAGPDGSVELRNAADAIQERRSPAAAARENQQVIDDTFRPQSQLPYAGSEMQGPKRVIPNKMPETKVGTPPGLATPEVVDQQQPPVEPMDTELGTDLDTKLGTEPPVEPMDTELVVEPTTSALDIAKQANRSATSPLNDLKEPTQDQKEAGNYQKGRLNVNGVPVAIENPAGSKRNPEWPALVDHYGDVKRTVGAEGTVGEGVDVFVNKDASGADIQSRPVFVIDQHNKDGSFDEHKAVFGAKDQVHAKTIYNRNYSKGWTGGKAVTQMTWDQFKAWSKDRNNTTKALADQVLPDVNPVATPAVPAQEVAPSVPKTAKTQPVSATEAVAGLRKALSGAQGRVLAEDEIREGKLQPETALAVDAISNAFGVQAVVFQDNRKDTGGYEFDGTTFVGASAKPVIFVNEKSERAPFVVAMHETLHQLRQRDQGVYTALRDTVVPLMKKEAVDAYTADLQASYDAETSGKSNPVPQDDVQEEMIADTFGDQAKSDKFWLDVLDKMEGKRPGLGKRMIHQVRSALSKAMKGLGVKDFGSEGWYHELTQVQDAFSTAAAAWLKKQGDTQAAKQMLKEAADVKQRMSRNQTKTKPFKDWFRSSRVVDSEGAPVTVYHGSTHDISAFTKDRAFAGNDLGQGFYFSNTTEDVSANYAGEGPDLTDRIWRLAEQIHSENEGMSKEEAKREARKTLSSGQPNMIPAYLAFQNPVILGKSSTDQETIFDIELEYDEDGDIIGEDGTFFELTEAIQAVSEEFDGVNVERVLTKLSTTAFDAGAISANDVYQVLRRSDGTMEIMDEDGNWAIGEFIRRVFEYAGFDGIIDHSVGDKFGHMEGVNSNTTHYIAFEPEQIKSAVGNRGTFDPDEKDIRFARRKKPSSDIGHRREISTGRYVGAPDWVGSSPQKLAQLRRKLKKLMYEGESGRYWYEESARSVMDLVGNDKADAEKFVALLAIYSQGTEVDVNAGFAIQAYYQWKAGLPIKTGRFPKAMSTKAENILHRDIGWGGVKTNNFYADLMEEIDPSKVDDEHATMDMWMAIAFDYGMKVLDQGPKYNFAKRETARLAKEVGWKPHQVQAAIWTAIKARVETSAKVREQEEKRLGIDSQDTKSKGTDEDWGKGAYAHFRTAHRVGMESKITPDEIAARGRSFADSLKARTAQISWEATPSVTLGDIPGIHSATFAQKMEYLVAVSKALHNKDKDLIADLVNLHTPPTIFGVSAWAGQTGAGAQSFIPAPVKGNKKKRAVLPEGRDLLNKYATVLGLILGQDMVAWHHPIFSDSAIRHNGLEIRTQQPLTESDVAELYAAISQEFNTQSIAPGYIPKGVRVLNFEEGLDNKAFQAGMRRVLDGLQSPAFDGAVSGSYRADSELVSNNWEVDTNGEGYTRSLTGNRSDLLERARDLRARVEKVNQDFSDRYGWGEVKHLKFSRRRGTGGSQPESISRDAAELRLDENGQVPLTHWGRQSGLSQLDPAKWGTAAAGQEKTRAGADFRPRTYFGLPGYRAESTVMTTTKARYFTTVDPESLYDLTADPDNLFAKVKADNPGWPVGALTNKYENAIIDAGYQGYWGQHAAGPIAALFSPVDVAETTYKTAHTETGGRGIAGYDAEGAALEDVPQMKLSRRPPADTSGSLSMPRGRRAVKKFQDSLYYHLVDRFKDLSDLQEAIGPVPESHDAFLAQENFSGRIRKRLDDLDDFHVRPLLDAIGKAGFTLEEVGRFLHARHAPEANAVLKRRNPKRKDNEALSGMSDEDAATILGEYAQNQAMFDIAERIDRINEDRLTNMINDHILTEQEAQAWRDNYEFYIPLHRDEFVDEDGELVPMPNLPAKGSGYHIAGKESQLRAGSTKEVNHALIIPHIVAQHEASSIRGEKNLVGQTLLNLAQLHPDPNFWTVDVIEKRPAMIANGEIVYRADGRLHDNELAVKVGGKVHRVSFNKRNPAAMRLITELKNLQGKNLPEIFNYAYTVMRYLSLINTSLSPEFVISNFARDMQTAGYNLGDTELDGLQTRILKDAVGKGIRGMWRSLNHKHDTEWARYADEFERAGGMVGWVNNYENIQDRAKAVANQLKLHQKGHVTRKTLHGLGDIISNANGAVENAVRLSAFVHGRRMGMSAAKAANLAKNLTVNFNRKGASSPYLNLAYLFFNASVQGSMRMIKAIHKSQRVRILTATTVVAAAILDMVNRAISGTDDDDRKYLDKLPDHVRNRNLIIFYGEGPTDYASIPLPWGYNIFHVIGQQIAAGIQHDQIKDYSVVSEGARLVTATMEAFNPLSSATLLQAISPTLMDPVAQISENKSWSGAPLAPEPNPFDPKPNSERYFRSVSTMSRDIAKTVNELSGGNDVRSGAIDMSPEWLDLIWDTATGSAGRFVLNTADTATKVVKGEEIDSKNIPFARKIIGHQYPAADYELYYNRMTDIDTLEAELDTFRGADRDKIREESGPKVKLISVKKRTEKRLKFLRKQRGRAEANGEKDRVKALDDKILKTMKEFNKRYQDQMFGL